MPFLGTSQCIFFSKNIKKDLALCAKLWDGVGMRSNDNRSKEIQKMIVRGSKTYTLPFSDIEMDVEYFIENEDVFFDRAMIGDQELAHDFIGVLVDTTKPSDIVSSSEYITLAKWIQSKLDKEEGEILDENGIHIKSEFEEHFNQKAFV